MGSTMLGAAISLLVYIRFEMSHTLEELMSLVSHRCLLKGLRSAYQSKLMRNAAGYWCIPLCINKNNKNLTYIALK